MATRTDACQTMLVSIGHGDGTFDGPHFYPLGFAIGIAVGNLDASPKLDVAVCRYYENDVKVLFGICSDPVSVEPPRYRFALDAVTPQPARSGSFEVRFHLADRSPASLEIVDVAGRRVLRERVDSFGPGDHVFAVEGRTRIPAGVYLVRLTSGTHTAATRAVVIQ